MTSRAERHRIDDVNLDGAAIEYLLCDADGNLFPSEEPAFDASVIVTNQFLQRFGLPGDRSAEELRVATTGKNFRSTAVDLVVAAGVPVEAGIAGDRTDAVIATAEQLANHQALSRADLEYWVHEERDVVTRHLGATLRPDDRVRGPLRRLSHRFRLAAVSSSASMRLAACFRATGLDGLMPADLRFSAEDSLAIPVSKPDPAVYLFAGEVLGVRGEQGLAIEDSVPGVLSAVAAGFPTVGNTMFVDVAERDHRAQLLRDAGACTVTESWAELETLLSATPSPSSGVA
ncbi:MAG: HAD family phosphatase [Actinomycetota bacterium]|nr:HAD family phosphatase [Actinomycetota bacterium]